jgi:YfiH family protein
MSKHLKAPNISFPHAFLSRQDGVSTGLYEGLNCGPGSNDDAEAVVQNRRIAAGLVSGSEQTPVLSCYQVHGNTAVVVTRDWGDDRPKADAMATNVPGLILGILTADCCPVLFADREAGIVGAAHAGWGGAIGGIVASTVAAMEGLGAQRKNIHAAIGPTIAQPSYEVGTEFRDRFTDTDPDFERFFALGKDSRHFQFGLPAFVRSRLEAEGISNVFDTEVDTYDSEHHFSYRRTTHRKEPDYGRQLSANVLPS